MHIGNLQTRSFRRHPRSASMLGFSLVEMMIVLALVMIVSAIAVVNTTNALKDARLNGGLDTAFMQLRLARERAIAERKRYVVTFGTPAPAGVATPLGAPNAKSIQVYRWDNNTVPAPAPVQISTIDLPTDVSFQTIPGIPTGAASVPDGWGNGITAIDFDQGVGAGAGNLVVFMPDGSARDLLANSDSGIVYLARNSDLASSRAITVFGVTGRIRAWRLMQPGGIATWTQQ